MAKKPQFSPEQLFQIEQRKLDRTAEVVAILIRALMWIAIAYFALLAIRALAGRATSASFALVVHWLTSERKAEVVAWIIAVVAIMYGQGERRLRKRKTRYMQQRIRDLEIRIDPGRSSSGLTESGNTRKGDQL